MADLQAVALKYRTPRWHRLNQLRAYANGTQYAGRHHFYDESVPLLERAPNVIDPVVTKAYRSNCDFVLGEGRWPTITSFSSEDSEDGLSETDSDILDAYISKAIEQARLKAAIRIALQDAQCVTTAVLVGCVIAGKLHVQKLDAEVCEVTLDPLNPNEVLRLECKYPYLDTFKAEDGKWKDRCLIYRRTIDATSDITYLPAEALETGADPDWQPDPALTFEHGFGFCPVVWYAFKGKCNGSDGHSMHAVLLDEIDALNFARSQKHRAAMYCGDPQLVETGVDKNANPTEAGRVAMIVVADESGSGEFRSKAIEPVGPNRGARRKGPGVVWRYESKDVDVKMLTLPPDALKAIDDDIRDLRAMIDDALAVVDIDVNNAKLATDISGKALECLYRKQTDHCSTIREDVGDGLILKTIDMLLRISLAVATSRPGALYIGGLKAVEPILARFMVPIVMADGTEQNVWFPPHLDLMWGPWFASTAHDETEIVAVCSSALDAGLATKKSCVEKLKSEGIFSINSVDEYLEAIRSEADDAQQRAMAVSSQIPATPTPPQQPEAE